MAIFSVFMQTFSSTRVLLSMTRSEQETAERRQWSLLLLREDRLNLRSVLCVSHLIKVDLIDNDAVPKMRIITVITINNTQFSIRVPLIVY